MYDSSRTRWIRRWIAGTGIFCLGAGSLWVAGCTRNLNGTQTASAANQTAKKADSRQVATSAPAGRVRLSDHKLPTGQPAEPGGSYASYVAAGRAVNRTSDPFAENGAVASRTQIPAQKAAQSSGPAVAQRSVAQPKPQAAASPRRGENRLVSASIPSGRAESSESRRVQQASRSVAAKSDRNAVNQPPIIRPAAPSNPAIATAADGKTELVFERQRADRLMERARTMLQNNFPEEALRLACVAEQLQRSHPDMYRRGEERPSDFVSVLRQIRGIDTTSSNSVLARKPARNKSQRLRGDLRQAIAGVDVLPAPGTSGDDTSPPWLATSEKSFAVIHAHGPLNRARGVAPDGVVTADATAPHFGSAFKSAGAEHTEAAGSEGELPAGDVSDPLLAQSAIARSPVTASTEIDDAVDEPVDADPLDEFVDRPAPGGKSSLNTASVIGLGAGILGLLGLAIWRRQERKAYAAARSPEPDPVSLKIDEAPAAQRQVPPQTHELPQRRAA